jgi:rRNA maturation endonuclease Nob1
MISAMILEIQKPWFCAPESFLKVLRLHSFQTLLYVKRMNILKERCEHCARYQQQGHNYCRMCGFHLMAGYVQHAGIAEAFNPNERFCGYCGGPKYECACSASSQRKI